MVRFRTKNKIVSFFSVTHYTLQIDVKTFKWRDSMCKCVRLRLVDVFTVVEVNFTVSSDRNELIEIYLIFYLQKFSCKNRICDLWFRLEIKEYRSCRWTAFAWCAIWNWIGSTIGDWHRTKRGCQ